MTNQLTLLFLVVVISGALCTVEDYVIMSQCAHNKAIYLAAEGTVSVTDISQTQNITIVGRPDFVNEDFKIALYAKETQRYLCFNDHWKLVGMKELQDTCYFNEAIVHGYFVFSSVVDRRRRIGFTQRGRAVGPKKVVNDACYMFTKIPTDQFFHQHNQFFQQQQQRVRATTARAPQSEEHLGSGMGRGSGSGSGRPNRHRNQHRNEDSSNRQQQHGKKSKLHSSGAGQVSRKRQHQQQRLQQMRGGGDSKNSTYLSSSRQQNVELGQYGAHNNHSGKHHNHSQPQYSHHHAARHHHSSNDSRRHHHYEQKQKSRAHHNRMRTSPSTAATTTSTTLMSTTPSKSSMAPNSTTRTTTIASTSLADVPPVPSEQGTFPTSSTSTTTTTMASHHDSLSTSMGHKHKGRRRKTHRKHGLHKSQAQTQGGNTQHDISPESSAATEETAEEDEDLTTDFSTWPQLELTSAQDFPGSVKPTSASLPSWETWYPSSVSTATFEQESSSDYAFSSISSKKPKEEGDKKLGISVSSPLPLNYDISPGTMSLPYPAPTTTTAAFPASSLVRQEDPPKSNDLLSQNTSKQTEAMEKQQRLEDEMNNEFKLHLAGNTSSSSSLNQSEEQDSSSEEVEETSAPDDNEDEAIVSTMASKLSDMPELTVTSTNNLMTDYIYATRTVPLTGNHKVSRHRHSHEPARHPHNAMQHHKDKLALQQKIRLENGLITTPTTSTTTTAATTTASSFAANPSTSQATLGANSKHVPQSLNTFSDLESSLPEITANTLSSTTTSLITAMPTLATAMSPSSSTPSSSTITSPSQTTTRKTLRKSTQKLLATPFHQLTYVRNEAGDIDIDSLDNISMYPDLEDNENVNGDGEMQPHHRTTSRFTMISGYHHQQQQHHPSTAAATSALPESIRIAKIKINRERKRMLRLRNIGGYNA